MSIVQVRESAALIETPALLRLDLKGVLAVSERAGVEFDPLVPLPQAPNEPPSSEQRNVTELVSV